MTSGLPETSVAETLAEKIVALGPGALPAATANGLPPKVEPWLPATMPFAARSVARQAPIGNPPPIATLRIGHDASGGVVTHKDASTRTVSAGGVDFAYRDVGPKAGVLVIFLTHLAAVLDNWDLGLLMVSRRSIT